MRTSTIKIAAHDLSKAGFSQHKPSEACEPTAYALDDKVVDKARVNAGSMTLMVEMITN
ncbi:hypothetical protein SAMN04488518_12114 [Pseudovibrio ascidiaceicola]|uniref:Uncharacterized protein n=1 Tax=Pseudovibrio ascidiaceicola TaxID=285279 RepID=A0A1I4FPY2_9HYPH|nr:hypothetical protein [Pseudovibrio ascidiaceicola]SFL19633.1 hypothetical protein SAMN04488518_12114 [Pseudovibrio ascidiaceicola]